MSVDIVCVTWRDEDFNEYAVIQRKEGEFVMSLNGQGHLPVDNLPGVLRELASKIERQTHLAQ